MTDFEFTFGSWRRYQVDYRSLVNKLHAHSLLGRVKFMIAAGGAVFFAITVLSWSSREIAHGAFGTMVCGMLAAFAGVWALRWWLLPWPGETESLVWLVCADIAVTVGALTVQDRLYGVIVTVLLVITSGYGCFHGPRVLALQGCWALVTELAAVVLLMTDGSPRLGGATGIYALGLAIILIMGSTIGVAFVTMLLCHWLWYLDALSDPLTMLMNRRGLDYYLRRHCAGTGERPGSVYVATLDLDRFKAVNDTFGHLFGDTALMRIADRLRSAIDADAIVARTGGEEFVVIGSVHEEPAPVIAERLRSAVETVPDLPVTITASVGVAVSDTELAVKPSTIRHLLCCADSAMYQAKHSGGNAVVTAETTAMVMTGAGRGAG
ncbi:GGDEF domain-containing protein [Nocardia sp. NPDC051570]|uniref:GGDEF domain-containing protein n=1 Tax=Nocardia sp. NPDC051570 TaxID=3364324 RepID=UPI0037A92D34